MRLVDEIHSLLGEPLHNYHYDEYQNGFKIYYNDNDIVDTFLVMGDDSSWKVADKVGNGSTISDIVDAMGKTDTYIEGAPDIIYPINENGTITSNNTVGDVHFFIDNETVHGFSLERFIED